MEEIINFFSNLTDINWIRENGGLYIVMAIVFAETGLFIGFFLPGDFLIFISGMLMNGYNTPTDSNILNWLFWSSLLFLCAVLGNFVGYAFGYKTGNYLFNMKDKWYLKKKHLYQAKEFYEKKGGAAIIFARFLPIVRTFAPIVAGVVKMDFKKFVLYNILGGALWIYGLTIAGFYLGEIDWVKNNLEYLVLGLVVITTAPVLYKMIFGKGGQVPHTPDSTDVNA